MTHTEDHTAPGEPAADDTGETSYERPWDIIPDGETLDTLTAADGPVTQRTSLGPIGFISAEEIVERDVLEQVSPVGDYWSASCPSHPDSNPSFSFGDNDEEPGVWLKDHSGACERDNIVDAFHALGIHREHFSGTFMPGNKNGPEYQRTVSYPYVDTNGEVVLWNIRGVATDGSGRKQFSQATPFEHPDKRLINGRSWGYNHLDDELKTRIRVPYRLPELRVGVAAGAVPLIAEGEKDVEAFFDAAVPGIVATTNAAGAGNWKREHWDHLVDAGATKVIVCVDLDLAGFDRVVKLLRTMPDSMSMSVIVPAVGEFGADHGADAHDHFAAGLGWDDFLSVSIDQIKSTIKEWKRREKAAKQPDLTVIDGGDDDDENYQTSVTRSFAESLEAWRTNPGSPQAEFSFQVEGGRVLVANSNHFGMGRTIEIEGPSGQTYSRFEVALDAVVWRSSVTTTYVIGRRGKPQEQGGRLYSVMGVLKDGRVFIEDGLSADDSCDIRKVIDLLDMGIGVPIDRTDKAVASNMLRKLGFDEREQIEQIAQTGWVEWTDQETGITQICHVTPQSTISANGVEEPLNVVGPVGSDVGALKPAMQEMGFPEVCATKDELAEAILAVNDFLAIAPERPDIPVALLGITLASFCRLSRRGSVLLNAEPDSAKSLMASATQAWVSGVPMDGKEFPVSIPNSSEAGVAATSSWAAHMPVVFDDYKTIRGDSNKTQRMSSVLMLAVQNAYGSSGGTKATQSGGLSFRGSGANTAIITAEKLPADQAILQRCLNVVLKRGDVQTDPRPGQTQAPIDDFRDRHHSTGNARKVTGTFISWLAGLANSYGSLDGLTTEVDRMARRFLNDRKGSRSAETVSVVEVGWTLFFQFCEDLGVDHLVDFDLVYDQLDVLVSGNKSVAADQDQGKELLQTLSDRISQRQCHIASYKGGCPKLASVAQAAGWRKNEGRDEFQQTNQEAGRFSRDGDLVLIYSDVMWRLARQENPDITAQELKRHLGPYLKNAGKPGDRTSRDIHPGSKRGYVFNVADLDLEPCDDFAKEGEF